MHTRTRTPVPGKIEPAQMKRGHLQATHWGLCRTRLRASRKDCLPSGSAHSRPAKTWQLPGRRGAARSGQEAEAGGDRCRTYAGYVASNQASEAQHFTACQRVSRTCAYTETLPGTLHIRKKSNYWQHPDADTEAEAVTRVGAAVLGSGVDATPQLQRHNTHAYIQRERSHAR